MYDGILLSFVWQLITCTFLSNMSKYVEMRDKYVDMQDIYVNMQHNDVDIQENCNQIKIIENKKQ